MDREEALALLRGGAEGIAEWNRRERWEDIPRLDQADLSGADLRDANLSGPQFRGPNFSEASWSETDGIRVVLSEANLSGADIRWANLSAASLCSANLTGANLSRANLSGAGLNCADLSGADLNDADLSWADLYGAILTGVNLSRANLNGANLICADLSGADLSRANFSGANLSCAGLCGADLSWANLSDANLEAADLRGVTNLTPAQLNPAENWPLACRDPELACGRQIPEPDDEEEIFNLTGDDNRAIEIAIRVARLLLNSPRITPDQVITINKALCALIALPTPTPGANYEFGIERREGDEEFREMRYFTFNISESYFSISRGGSTYSKGWGSDSYSEPGWSVEIGGHNESSGELYGLDDTINEHLNLGAEITISDESETALE